MTRYVPALPSTTLVVGETFILQSLNGASYLLARMPEDAIMIRWHPGAMTLAEPLSHATTYDEDTTPVTVGQRAQLHLTGVSLIVWQTDLVISIEALPGLTPAEVRERVEARRGVEEPAVMERLRALGRRYGRSEASLRQSLSAPCSFFGGAAPAEYLVSAPETVVEWAEQAWSAEW